MSTTSPERNELLETSLIETAIESWRFSRAYVRAVTKLDVSEQARFVSQLRYFLKRLEEQLETAGLRLVNVEGQMFEPGVAATAINIAEFSADESLIVDQMLEPIIMSGDGVRRAGTVVLRKALV